MRLKSRAHDGEHVLYVYLEIVSVGSFSSLSRFNVHPLLLPNEIAFLANAYTHSYCIYHIYISCLFFVVVVVVVVVVDVDVVVRPIVSILCITEYYQYYEVSFVIS